MRRIISILSLIAFLIVSVSGLQLVFGGNDRPKRIEQQIVSSTDDVKHTMNMTEKPFYPKKAHEWAGFLFIGAGIVHIVLNRKPMLSYFRFGKR